VAAYLTIAGTHFLADLKKRAKPASAE